jgi:hypothetical protein
MRHDAAVLYVLVDDQFLRQNKKEKPREDPKQNIHLYLHKLEQVLGHYAV